MDSSLQSVVLPQVKVKPKGRGVSHLFGFTAALGGLAFLYLAPSSGLQRDAGMIYGLSLVLTLGISALYHRPMWSHPARRIMRRLDHAGIAVLIAGTYTPLATADSGGQWTSWLTGMWLGTLATWVFTFGWSYAPRGLRTGLYMLLGLIALPVIARLPKVLGPQPVFMLLVGAAIYIAGGVVYALRRPNPSPGVFGYHEVFHVMVIAAAGVHYAVILEIQHLVQH